MNDICLTGQVCRTFENLLVLTSMYMCPPVALLGMVGLKPQSQSAWEVCLKAATEGGWVVVKDFEGAADHISLILDGICHESAVRCASAAAADEQEKLHREQQIAVKMTNASSNNTTIDSSFSPQGSGSEGKTVTTQQAGASGVAPAAARSAVPRRTKLSGGARKTKDFVSKMCPEYPLFKALSAGEGGAVSTRAHPVASVALR